MNQKLNKMTNTRYGKMLYNQNDYFIGKSLEEYGEWAQAELEFLTPYIPVGGIIMDVGAYIGTHTLYFADAVGPNGIVIAIEPQQVMFQLLCANVALNNFLNVRAFNLAVDETAGLVQINEVDYRHSNNFGAVAVNRFEGYPVEARSLDDIAMPSLDLIKIDVEGLEPEVINGAAQAIRMHEPFVYMEYNPHDQSQDLVQLMQSMDYDVYQHISSAYNPRNFKKCNEDCFNGYTESNIFCVPKSKGLMIDLPLMPE
ncbi:MAG: methyltransferase, FkbM family [Parachlamydiales bacterium]|nr:methyltransferase, FkbM family [Parachlamydiales bacterium]